MPRSDQSPDPSDGPPGEPARAWTPPSGWSPEQPAAWSGWGQPTPAPGQPPAPGHGPPSEQAPLPSDQAPSTPSLPSSQSAPNGWGQPPAPPPGWGQPGPPSAPPPAGWGQRPEWTPPAPAPKPGIVALRPLGVGDLLEGALGFIRSNPRTILGLAAVVAAVVALIQTLGLLISVATLGPALTGLVGDDLPAELSADMSQLLVTSLAQLIPGVVTALLQVVASGLFIVLLGAAVLGKALTPGQSWAALRPRLLPLVGLTALLVLGGLALVAVSAGSLALLVAILGAWGALAGVVLLAGVAAAMLIMYVRLAVAAPALVLEGIGPVSSVARSWRLVGGSSWRVAGILLLTALVTALLTAVVSVPVGMVTAAMAGFAPSALSAGVAAGITGLIAGIVTWPFTAAVSGLLYLDLRMRHEPLAEQLVTFSASGQTQAGDGILAAFRRS